ncbi:MAG: FAD:protein FMN transferase [Balneolaceae bacterium]
MNTRCNVVLPGMEETNANYIFHSLKDEAVRTESILSRFLPESEISKINRLAFGEPVKISNEVYSILKTCQNYFSISNGAFDVTLYPLIKYWNEKESRHPQISEFRNIVRDTGMGHITLNDDEKSVSFGNENIEIDLGGFGKGYALEKMNRLLNNFAVENAFISFGESSVLTVGSHPAGDCWKVGVNNCLIPGSSHI